MPHSRFKGDDMFTPRFPLLFAVCILCADAAVFAQNATESFRVTLKPDDVHQIARIDFEANGLRITADDVTVVPIRCDKGITGCIILGDGEFHFKPDGQPDLKGHFRGGMFRFNPADQKQFLPLETAQVRTDHAVYAMSSHLLKPLFNHCWQSNGKALIPDSGAFAASLYAKDHGDLLISTQNDSFAVYNFSKRQRLYAEK